jgi:hypothetical protein
LQRSERFPRTKSEQAAGFSEAAPTPVALDEPLPSSSLEQAQVFARTWLTDSDAPRSRRDSPLPFDFDEQAKPGGVPEKRKRCIGHNDDWYRKIRLAP